MVEEADAVERSVVDAGYITFVVLLSAVEVYLDVLTCTAVDSGVSVGMEVVMRGLIEVVVGTEKRQHKYFETVQGIGILITLTYNKHFYSGNP